MTFVYYRQSPPFLGQSLSHSALFFSTPIDKQRRYERGIEMKSDKMNERLSRIMAFASLALIEMVILLQIFALIFRLKQ